MFECRVDVAKEAIFEPTDADLTPEIFRCLTQRSALIALGQKQSAPSELAVNVDDVPPRDIDTHPNQGRIGANLQGVRSSHILLIPGSWAIGPPADAACIVLRRERPSDPFTGSGGPSPSSNTCPQLELSHIYP